ncbi:hypothetical protein ACFVVA_20000 [Kitasatospora sp. NPDC058048]|uniref:hypothetical protein n=1 Tax=Kitasatospora sp. NPDC058048 TaxID=3346313 RepID=UPI0036D7BDEB
MTETAGADFGLAGLDPATADDAVGSRVLHHSGADFTVEHAPGLRTSTALGAVDGRHIAAVITRDQRAGTYTVRLHHTGDSADARTWLATQAARATSSATLTAARRAAATARSTRTSPAGPAPAAASAAPAGRSAVRHR